MHALRAIATTPVTKKAGRFHHHAIMSEYCSDTDLGSTMSEDQSPADLAKTHPQSMSDILPDALAFAIYVVLGIAVVFLGPFPQLFREDVSPFLFIALAIRLAMKSWIALHYGLDTAFALRWADNSNEPKNAKEKFDSLNTVLPTNAYLAFQILAFAAWMTLFSEPLGTRMAGGMIATLVLPWLLLRSWLLLRYGWRHALYRRWQTPEINR